MKLAWTAAVCSFVALSSSVALADPPAPDPEVSRLEQAGGHSVKWNYVPAGKTDRYGHAEVLVSSPLAYVRELVQDYSHYKEFSSGKFKTSRLIDKTDTTSDLYIQVPVLHGMVTLWQVLRFGAPRVTAAGVEVIEGTYVRGNVRTSHVLFTLRAVGDKTVLKADLDVAPDFAAPQSMVDEELRDAAQNAVDAVQARAQQKYAQWLAANTPAAPANPVASSTPAPQAPPSSNQ